MNYLDTRRFEHKVSEPKELRDGDFVEMSVLKRNRDLFRLVYSATHATVCIIEETSND